METPDAHARLALRGRAHGPGHDRRAVEFLDQERDLVRQILDVPGEQIGPGPLELVEIRPFRALLVFEGSTAARRRRRCRLKTRRGRFGAQSAGAGGSAGPRGATSHSRSGRRLALNCGGRRASDGRFRPCGPATSSAGRSGRRKRKQKTLANRLHGDRVIAYCLIL